MELRVKGFKALSEKSSVPVRTLRTLWKHGAIPGEVIGHRTIFFVPSQVDRALARYTGSACEATNVSETAFYSWIRRGEEGERPFAQFAQAVAGARGKGKIKVQRDIWGCNDPRVKLELLARIYPEEFGRTAERRCHRSRCSQYPTCRNPFA
jgi:hypothetical protein